jgi:serine/threonine protein kinase
MKLEDIIEDNRYCYIVTELCEGITLKDYIGQKKTLGEQEAMAIFRKLAAGSLAIAHECMIHRDLKPANAIISPQGDIKIIDFGYCEIIRAKKVMKTFNVGSPTYMSPEAYQKTLYS